MEELVGVRELLQTHSRETDLTNEVSENNHNSVHLLCRMTFTPNYNESFTFDASISIGPLNLP